MTSIYHVRLVSFADPDNVLLSASVFAVSCALDAAGQDYWNLKIMGFDKMEEDLALFVRRMQPSPKAFKRYMFSQSLLVVTEGIF